ncbi:unnamed protein product [Ixodes pacificus]
MCDEGNNVVCADASVAPDFVPFEAPISCKSYVLDTSLFLGALSFRRGLEAGCGSRVMSGFYCHRVFAASIYVLVFGVSLTTAHDHQQQAAEPISGDTNSENTIVANEIKKKWSAQDVVRDLEHIKQDLAKLIELEGAGAMSQQELAFYYLRMHDFDNNNLLDGHELMAAMHHTKEAHNHDEEGHHSDVDELIRLADSALEGDLNQDGFLSYPEIRTSLDKNA